MKKIILICVLFISLSACNFNKCDRLNDTCGEKVKIGKWFI